MSRAFQKQLSFTTCLLTWKLLKLGAEHLKVMGTQEFTWLPKTMNKLWATDQPDVRTESRCREGAWGGEGETSLGWQREGGVPGAGSQGQGGPSGEHCHLSLCTAAALVPTPLGGGGWGVLHQLAVFTLGTAEKKPGCERNRRGEGRKANDWLLDSCFVLGGSRAALLVEC